MNEEKSCEPIIRVSKVHDPVFIANADCPVCGYGLNTIYDDNEKKAIKEASKRRFHYCPNCGTKLKYE